MYLIRGDEQYFINQKIDEILNAEKQAIKEEIDLIKFYDFFSIEEFAETLSNLGLFSAKKVVIIKNPYFFNLKNKISKSVIDEFVQLIKQLNNAGNCTFIFSQEIYKYDTSFSPSSAYLFVSKFSKIIEANKLEERELFAFVYKMIKQKNATISEITLANFLVNMPNNLSLIESEIDKLILVDKNISQKMIDDNNFSMSNNIDFALTEAILKWKNPQDIVKKIQEQLNYGIDSNQILNQIASILINSKNIAVLKNTKPTNDEISKVINIHPYRVKLHREFLNKIGLKKLDSLITNIAKIDVELKQGKIKDEIFVDLLTLEFIK
ncbi:DNA polymerase III subunit delta [Mycoplasma enhydrae]|nr:DNA polymerase III subunit delta [Mycoplasma enhydrae]